MTADLLTRIAEVTAGSEVAQIHIRVLGEKGPETPFRSGRKRRF